MRLFLVLAIALALPVWADVPTRGKVIQVIDGDTLILDSGEHVRLLDINTTEKAHGGELAQEGSAEGKKVLENLVLGKEVKLEYGKKTHDFYKRLLAHVYLPDGTWVNKELVASGWAHVYTFPDNNLHGDTLIKVEDKARSTKSGLWALPRWQIIDASNCCKDEQIGRFELVRGKVLKVVHADKRVYLNFGRDWKTDFTVMLTQKDEKLFKKQGVKNLEDYTGKMVLVRGFTMPVNGVMVRTTHPQQIEVVE